MTGQSFDILIRITQPNKFTFHFDLKPGELRGYKVIPENDIFPYFDKLFMFST